VSLPTFQFLIFVSEFLVILDTEGAKIKNTNTANNNNN